ncbi:MAG: cytochrome P450 [Pseudomonadales bacterium]
MSIELAMKTTRDFGLDLFDPIAIARPHAFYARLREEAPIAWSDQLHGWVLTRHEDVRRVLRDSERYSSVRGQVLVGRSDIEIEEVAPRGTLTMLGADRPDHTRLRKLLAIDFTPKRIVRMQPRIEAVTRRLLAEIAPGESFDVVQSLAVPLPVTIIAELLGVPAELGAQFKIWSDAATEPVRPDASDQQVRERNARIVEFREYLQDQIERRRFRPTDDFIGRLVAAHDDESRLTDAELLAAVNLLLLAGNETTTNLISNAVLALTRFPDQADLLRNHPDLIDNAVEEFLRYDGSVQFTTRRALADDEFHGQRIARGDTVVIVLASANRDARVFDDPDTLDVRRDIGRHLAFGDWIHICLGQFLARMETRAAILGILQKFPSPALAEPEDRLEYRANFNLRGPNRLVIRTT